MNNISKDKLIELVKKIVEFKGTEDEVDSWLDELERSVIHPNVSDLIYYPENPDVTVEEIVDQIMSYKPISL